METYESTQDKWRSQAACRDTDPNLFFPVGTTGPAVQQIENAKAICKQCDSQVACLEFALYSRQDYGIWGGTTERERLKILKSSSRNIGQISVNQTTSMQSPKE